MKFTAIMYVEAPEMTVVKCFFCLPPALLRGGHLQRKTKQQNFCSTDYLCSLEYAIETLVGSFLSIIFKR